MKISRRHKFLLVLMNVFTLLYGSYMGSQLQGEIPLWLVLGMMLVFVNAIAANSLHKMYRRKDKD